MRLTTTARVATFAGSLLLVSLASRFAFAEGPARVIHVNVNASPGGNGQDWAHAYNNLQDALIEAAQTAGAKQIWVAAGTYKSSGTGISTASFTVPDQTSIYGGFAGIEASMADRNTSSHATVLTGDLLGNDVLNRDDPGYALSKLDNSLHVVTIADKATVRLDGVTVSGGFARGGAANDPTSGKGAGIYVSSGGYYGIGTDEGTAYLTLVDVAITDNAAPGGPGASGIGGGLWQPRGTLTIEQSVFANNTANFAGGALLAGYYNLPPIATMDSLVIRSSSFTDNASVASGNVGVLNVRAFGFEIEGNSFSRNSGHETVFQLIYRPGTNVLAKALVSNNTFDGNNTAEFGGAMQLINRLPPDSPNPRFTLRGNAFANNASSSFGGALFVTGSGDYRFDRNTFTHNLAGVGGGAMSFNGATGNVVIEHNQFVRNSVEGTPLTEAFLRLQAASGFFISPAFRQGGGAIAIDDGSNNVRVEASTFNGNSAPLGGAISVTGYSYFLGEPWNYDEGLPGFMLPVPTQPASATISGNRFVNNRAVAGDGGAIFSGAITTPSAPFVGETFPAMVEYGPTTVAMTGSMFLQNTASGRGGAITGDRTTVTVTLNTFHKDTATGPGSEVYCESTLVNSYSTATQPAHGFLSLVSQNTWRQFDSASIVLK